MGFVRQMGREGGSRFSRVPRAAAMLGAALALTPACGGLSPVRAQDFSITNTIEPTSAARRDVLRQLQAWWDVHAYYPRRAAQNDEGGTVRLHLTIRPDGNIWTIDVVQSSGSGALDGASVAAFRGGFVRPFPEGLPGTELDVPVHYILSRRRDEPAPAGTTQVASRARFSITNEPVTSPILDTMLLRTCTGTVVKQGIRNHPAYGTRFKAEAIFFRRPDGTPWVKFYEGGYPIMSPVVEVGKVVHWTGRDERIGNGLSKYTRYTGWPEGENTLIGNLEIIWPADAKASQELNRSGTVDFVCTNETVPAVEWSAMRVTSGPPPAGDPP